MKKLLALIAIGSTLFISSNSAKADSVFDYWGIKRGGGKLDKIEIYTINSSTGQATLKNDYCKMQYFDACYFVDTTNKSFVDESGILNISLSDFSNYIEYDPKNNTFTEGGTKWKSDYTTVLERPILSKDATGNISIGIEGDPLITKKTNGELHIGENSWITKEENGRQKVWAKDANGNSIPIDYTNGTKLLINGRDVEQSINNVGALSAALTGLPTVPTDTTLACGLGTGTHGGDLAFSGGCASKVNEKLSINYAASMTMPGQDYAGDFEDQFSARAGFVWKLGKATNPKQISMQETNELKKEISDLKENNKNIIAQNKTLLERLERLEKVALRDLKSKDLAVYKIK